ncbi:MAG: hypothetical protein Q4C54_07650 [Clostridia bacterium]|nr:hypothetical protein [Clostridia bacterium]
MLRISNINIPLDYNEATLKSAAARKLHLPEKAVQSVKLQKRSVDARDKGDVHFVVTVDAAVEGEAQYLKKKLPAGVAQVTKKPAAPVPCPSFTQRPVVVGAGPAGLFAALTLACAGAKPILIERGKCVDDRAADVDRMRENGILDTESNVQFGEGGAGAFSDGKLTTGIKSPFQKVVLESLVKHGAPEEILYLQMPHIGTDLLRGVVASIRQEIISRGGVVMFSTRLTQLIVRGSHVEGIRAKQGDRDMELMTDTVLLCIGHSARDTIQSLFNQGVEMTQKPFAMGVRIEHLQEMVNRSQYGKFYNHPALGAAPYKLAAKTPDGRGAYTFCMCPGGEVIAAASQEGGLVVNGMSYHARAGRNANAALLVGVRPEDFGDDHPLSGMVLQRSIEQAAFRLGGGNYRAPAQRVEDFLNHRPSTGFGEVSPSYRPGVTPCDLHECLPEFITQDLAIGIRQMDRQLHGFASPDAVLTGVETRSSSPVRIPRDESLMASLTGLYPVGEGAGYAGGIVSAAVDGIRAAHAAMERSNLL